MLNNLVHTILLKSIAPARKETLQQKVSEINQLFLLLDEILSRC